MKETSKSLVPNINLTDTHSHTGSVHRGVGPGAFVSWSRPEVPLPCLIRNAVSVEAGLKDCAGTGWLHAFNQCTYMQIYLSCKSSAGLLLSTFISL